MSQLLLEPWRDLLIAQPWLAWIWITLVGACIGSFLNVVIYRLPARMSLSRPGSHCPRCQQPIRWYDNIPIIAWCWLRGRCRNCQLPISIRYPLVELLIALLFATQWYLDVGRLQSTLTTDDALLQAIARFALHSLWLVVLVVFTGIDADGQPAPRSLLIFTTITILFGNEWIQPSAARDLTERISHQGPVAVTTAVLATLTGLFDGRSTRSIKRKKKEINATPEIARSEILAHAIIGGLTGWMAKGWQGVGLVVLAVGMAWVGREAGWPRFASRWWMWLLVATLLSELAS